MRYSFLSNKITEWKQGKESPLGGCTVIVGKDLSLNAKGSTDVVRGAIIKEATTDNSGTFKMDIPAGRHAIILWKPHYVPQTDNIGAPGKYTGSISEDTQVGASGRHMSLSRQK